MCVFFSLNFVDVQIVSGTNGANVKGASVAWQSSTQGAWYKRVCGMHPGSMLQVACTRGALEFIIYSSLDHVNCLPTVQAAQ